MRLLTAARRYWRFSLAVRDLLARPMTLPAAQAVIRRRMADRDTNFLRMVETGVFGNPRSPYLTLLSWAGAELGDIRQMIGTQGLEGTLKALRGAGVYVAFEEFKGRKPIVRAGRSMQVRPSDFDNPRPGQHYQTQTGGTTGPAISVAMSLDHLAAQVPHNIVGYDAHGILHAPMAIWHDPLPNYAGLNNLLRAPLCGHPVERWFSPVAQMEMKPSLGHRITMACVIFAGRLAGVSMPRPETVRLDQAGVVARWAAQTAADHGASVVRTGVSRAVRVSMAAREHGLNLTGVTFVGGGERPTPAKVQEMTRTGARWLPIYALTEAGPVGWGCGRPTDENDLHFLKDTLALIQHPREVPGIEASADAFYLTTLVPTTPKILLNVEVDEYGALERRSCGCPLEAYGFAEHLRSIQSFSKVSSEAHTVAGDDIIQILQEVLPARFGGGPLDYQLVQEEDAAGLTRLNLVASPRIEVADSALIEAFLHAVSDHGTRSAWAQAATLRVKRMEPIWTRRGKLMPVHLERRPADHR